MLLVVSMLCPASARRRHDDKQQDNPRNKNKTKINMMFWFSTANKRQSTFLLDHKLHDNLPLVMGMARAENRYSLVRYSTIEG